MKKAIVSGSTGFIGSILVKHLTERGIEVVALGRQNFDDISNRVRKNINQASYLKIRMEDIEDLQDALIKINWNAGDECVFFNLAWGGEEKL